MPNEKPIEANDDSRKSDNVTIKSSDLKVLMDYAHDCPRWWWLWVYKDSWMDELYSAYYAASDALSKEGKA